MVEDMRQFSPSIPDPSTVRHRLPPQLKIGAVIVATIVIVAIIAPWIAPYQFDKMDVNVRFEQPSENHWFGTDEFGRDVLSRLLIGGRFSLLMGFIATFVSLLFGIPIGLISGFFRGKIDELLMRTADVFMSLPPILLALVILAVSTPSIWKTAVAVGVIYTPLIARVTRSVTLNLAKEDFIEAAHARGEGISYILFREILPNAWPPIIVEASIRVSYAILLAAALSFLGLGAQPPSSDWGLMIAEARSFIERAPWIALAPGVAMSLLVIGVNMVGDGLREVLDPRARDQLSKGEI